MEKLTNRSMQIYEGPSKFDLMCSLFDCKKVQITIDPEWQRNLNIKKKDCPKADVIFKIVGVSNDSSDCWEGEIYFCEFNEIRRFYYNSKKRTGCVYGSFK